MNAAWHTPRTPLHLGRHSRVQRYSSSMHRAMEEDSLMIRHDDDDPMHPKQTDKQQIVQNTALRIATGCTHDTNTQHLHEETNVLPIHQHLQLHASQIRQKAQHPLHKLTIQDLPFRTLPPQRNTSHPRPSPYQ